MTLKSPRSGIPPLTRKPPIAEELEKLREKPARSSNREPLLVFRLPVIRRFGNGQFQCRVCGEPRCTLSRVQRHVVNHFVSYEIAKNIDLNDIPEVQQYASPQISLA